MYIDTQLQYTAICKKYMTLEMRKQMAELWHFAIPLDYDSVCFDGVRDHQSSGESTSEGSTDCGYVTLLRIVLKQIDSLRFMRKVPLENCGYVYRYGKLTIRFRKRPISIVGNCYPITILPDCRGRYPDRHRHNAPPRCAFSQRWIYVMVICRVRVCGMSPVWMYTNIIAAPYPIIAAHYSARIRRRLWHNQVCVKECPFRSVHKFIHYYTEARKTHTGDPYITYVCVHVCCSSDRKHNQETVCATMIEWPCDCLAVMSVEQIMYWLGIDRR